MSDNDSDPGVPELQADIESAREELADTVDQLAAKLDLPSRVKTTLHDATITDANGKPTPIALSVAGVIAAALAAFVAVRVWSRKRRGGRRRRRGA